MVLALFSRMSGLLPMVHTNQAISKVWEGFMKPK
jgi:hypothetical protein